MTSILYSIMRPVGQSAMRPVGQSANFVSCLSSCLVGRRVRVSQSSCLGDMLDSTIRTIGRTSSSMSQTVPINRDNQRVFSNRKLQSFENRNLQNFEKWNGIQARAYHMGSKIRGTPELKKSVEQASTIKTVNDDPADKDSEYLQTLINNFKDQSNILTLPPNSTITLDVPVYITGKTNFTLDGNGSTLIAGANFAESSNSYPSTVLKYPMGPLLGIYSGKKVTIKNIKFVGPGAEQGVNTDPKEISRDTYKPPDIDSEKPNTQGEAAGTAVFFRDSSEFQISQCTISEFQTGIIVRYCSNGAIGIPKDIEKHQVKYDFSKVGLPDLGSLQQEYQNTIFNIRHTSISVQSSTDVSVCGNIVSNNVVNYFYSNATNAYGISFSMPDGEYTMDDPKQSTGSITANKVSNVWTWNGIDVHGGKEIAIAFNEIADCKTGVGLQYNSEDTTKPAMVTDILINNNLIQRTTSWPKRETTPDFPPSSTFRANISSAKSSSEAYGEADAPNSKPQITPMYPPKTTVFAKLSKTFPIRPREIGPYLASLFGPAILCTGMQRLEPSGSNNLKLYTNKNIKILRNTISGFGCRTVMRLIPPNDGNDVVNASFG